MKGHARPWAGSLDTDRRSQIAEWGNGSMRTALVTGASAGVGRELVRQLVRDRGMTVLATARRPGAP